MGAKVFTGTLVFAENNAAAQVMKTIPLTKRTKISSIWIDGINTARQIEATLWVKIDGANSRQVQDYDSIMAITEAINLLMAGAIEETTEVVIKLQCDGLGAGNVNIPYSIPYDDSIENVQSVFNGSGDADDVDLKARSLEIDNDTGDAVIFQSSGGNGDGIDIRGHGTGRGINVTGGATGRGINISGGGTSGDGINIATTDGKGISIESGGANGIGIDINSNLQSLRAISDNDADAFDIRGNGGGSAMKLTAGATSHALELIGGATSGNGINISTTVGDGIKIAAAGGEGMDIACTDGNFAGVKITGKGTEPGINVIAGITGIGLKIAGGATSGDGLYISTTDGSGMHIAQAGVGLYGINISSSGAGINIASTASNGITIAAGTNSNGIDITGDGTGHGIYSKSGAGATGDGIKAESLATNGNGINGIGTGTENGMKLSSSATGKGMEINQQTKLGIEDILELMHSRLGGKHTFGNTGGGGEIEAKLYSYSELVLRKTLSVLKPDLTDNDVTLDVSALAGQEQ